MSKDTGKTIKLYIFQTFSEILSKSGKLMTLSYSRME